MMPESVTAIRRSSLSDQRKNECGGERPDERSHEDGWALIGLLMALGVMSIFLASAIVPNIQKEVQRDKEAEMLYRGQQMAEGIARYYGRGRKIMINMRLGPPTPLPFLTDLSKLRDGVNIGVRELKFVRPSAMIDPMTNSEWEPVRARDPRIMKFLQAWAAETLSYIPQQLLDIAAPPRTSVFKNSNPSSTNQTPGSEVQGQPNNSNTTSQTNPGGAQVVTPHRPATSDDDDDDDDDDDPFADMLDKDQPGHSNLPIVGVASKRKGPAMNAYFGLSNYEDWIFLYIEKVPPGGIQNQRIPGGQGNQRNRVSQ
jgi:type II secretory pathway pseudopilin PulG